MVKLAKAHPNYTCTVQSKRKFTLASARHASPRNITRAQIASRGTNTRNEKQQVDKKYLAAKKVPLLLSTQSVLFRPLTILSIKASMNYPATAAVKQRNLPDCLLISAC